MDGSPEAEIASRRWGLTDLLATVHIFLVVLFKINIWSTALVFVTSRRQILRIQSPINTRY